MNFRNKKICSIVLSIALLLSMIIVPFENVVLAENEEKITEITIVHTNDIHGRIKEGKYDGMGLSKISTKVKELRKDNPNVLLLDAGDTLHGLPIVTISKGERVIELMNIMGYDAMAAGNHDFNYGAERLMELSKKANFPIFAANVVKEEDGTRVFEDYIIKDMNGLKVGIFGLTTPETKYKAHPRYTEGLDIKDPAEVSKKLVKEIKEQGADIIIAVSHLGIDEDSEFKSTDVAEKVEGIDLIVDGHSHSTLNEGKLVGDTLIVQAGEYSKNLGIVNLQIKDGQVVHKKANLITKEEAEDIEEDEEINSLIEKIEKKNSELTSEVLGETKVRLDGEREKVRAGETNLANIITNAMLKAGEADLTITNGGGIRDSIEAGKITKGDVIKVLPFANQLTVKEVKGIDILNALEHGTSSYPEPKGAFPQVAGMTYKLDHKKEAGKRIYDVKIQGKPLDIDKTYRLATNDFMAAGGDGYTMFEDGKLIAEYPALDEIVAEYIRELKVIDQKVENRLTVVEGKEEPVVKPKPELKPEPKPKEFIYVVKPGDVLYRIGINHGINWQQIAKANNIRRPYIINPGQKLKIPGKQAPKQPAKPAKKTTYVVKSGDVLYRIGINHGVNWQKIARANRIRRPYIIHPGQRLTIPAN